MSDLIHLQSNLYHAFGFRHLSRMQAPPEGDVWEFNMLCSDSALIGATATVKQYFGTRLPRALYASPVPRAKQTLEWLWPRLEHSVTITDNLGPTVEEVAGNRWDKINAIPNAYDASAKQCYEADEYLMQECGMKWLRACHQAAVEAGPGEFAATCSHFGNADTGVRIANRRLGLCKENEGWLPGRGFESGGFAHLAWTSQGRLVKCEYHSPAKVY